MGCVLEVRSTRFEIGLEGSLGAGEESVVTVRFSLRMQVVEALLTEKAEVPENVRHATSQGNLLLFPAPFLPRLNHT